MRSLPALSLALLLAGCGPGGTTTVPSAEPTGEVSARAPRPHVVAAPAASVPAPLATARHRGRAVARAATRRLYARVRARVEVPGSTRRLLRELDRFPMPQDLRGSPARATAVEVVLETPTRAVLWWVVADRRTRTPLAVALEQRGGSWRATEMLAD
jgi:hypothetical protein